MENNDQIKYLQAKKRVKQIKGFYIHAAIYVCVNLLVIALKSLKYENIEIKDFFGIGLWGIGLLVHGLSVFLPNFILGNDWEERKIRELMDKNKGK